jgi:hypothetical protein
MNAIRVGVAAILVAAGTASAQILPEIEDNHTKALALANGAFILGDGMGVMGTSTGTVTTAGGITSADYYLIQNVARPVAIYRHRLTLDSSIAGHTASIRGITQTAAPAGPWTGTVGTGNAGTDVQHQTHFIPAGSAFRVNQWYGFGKQEQFYYRVTGTASTTASYTAVLTTEAVIPMALGTFQPGQITITTMNQGHTSDTDFWVYDSNLDPIVGYGNDDNSIDGGGTGAGFQGHLVRNYGPGTYYIAMSNFQTANDQPAPSDDRFRTGNLMDFPNIIANGNTGVNINVTFSLIDSTGTYQFPATRAGQHDVVWAQFTVVPAPGTLALLGFGGLLTLRRRR